MTAPRNPAPTTGASGIMTKFRIGDTIRITHTPCRYFDQVGTVEDVNEHQDHPFAVDGLEPWPLWFGADEMVLAEWAPTGEGS